ncbi:translation initiation factor IF-2 N-terminal domain-containing protein [uncultured Eubacterium sp.]|uniref:translation initiation factor IF-2 N-terminal domain-containing protein n=1 Tax=uncultured Eubacterium sp. TaxID=165185 RepID=UPI002599913E|nr:translation initiation factor IF-2 N-terminal domain-containing protein [uncultured Eubacterium sp.]
MKIYELAKELQITPKELITFFRQHDFSVSSHMQKATDEMIDLARKEIPNITKENKNESNDDSKPETTNNSVSVPEPKIKKVFKPDDEIPCKSVTPWKLTAVGVDKNTVYHWEYFGDVEYLKYRDLQALRRTEYITKPNILIMDEDLREQWKRELAGVYKYFDGIEYPEEYFDLPDDEFEDLLKNAPHWLSNVIETTAMAMIRAENYPSVNKIILIDKILGTCIKDFL